MRRRAGHDRMQRVPSDSAGSSVAADTYVADLHIHSRYSRACSRDLTLPNLAWWARRKGIAAARHRRLHPSGLVRPPAGEPATGRAGPVPAGRGGRAATVSQRLPPARCRRAGRPVHAQRRDLHDLQARRPDPQGAPPDLPARLRRGGPVQHRAGPDRQPRPPTAGRSSAWTPATCWRSRWRPARTATWCRRTSGRRGSPRSARSPASTRSPTATPTWPSTSSRWRPACPPTRR